MKPFTVAVDGTAALSRRIQADASTRCIEPPLAWKKPRFVFVNSMSDHFHDEVSLSYLRNVFQDMTSASWHVFQVLTKRSERLAEVLDKLIWPANVWMGVSVESEDYTYRIDHLGDVPASVRFLSVEPLEEH